ncbi:MAG: nucleotidyltransferase domain-containing protein [Christensenellales bacterium]|jgi:hypothetical protein
MFDVDAWTGELIDRLRGALGENLLFVGLQGSYLRGEATEQSDLDIMCALERVDMDSLGTYRRVLAAMPDQGQACGFICSREDLANWPRYELLTLERGTRPLYGRLAPLLPSYTRQDIRRGVAIGAANLYHESCHRYLYGAQGVEGLRGAYKAAFYVLQQAVYLREGVYVSTRRALADRLAGEERALLTAFDQWEAQRAERQARPEAWFGRMIHWCQRMLRESSEK